VQISYCLPIITRSKQKVLDEIVAREHEYQCFEIWLDYIDDLDPAFVRQLIEKYPGRLILLFRRQLLEPIHMPLQERERLMVAVTDQPVFLDLDISEEAELEYLAANRLRIRVNLIGSHHNYIATPILAELQTIAVNIAKYQPEAIKIATYCRSEEDALRLLQLQLWLKKQGRQHIVIGMGPFGAITRVFGTLWGNELVYAPQHDDEASAPGQLTRGQLENIFRSLGV
jgi:3-dehydroquinate dehydratase type I